MNRAQTLQLIDQLPENRLSEVANYILYLLYQDTPLDDYDYELAHSISETNPNDGTPIELLAQKYGITL